jgi:nucleoid-associated protein YgaU
LIVHPGFRHNGPQITMAATGNIMKPLVLFSGLAIACAVGLLALSYQGWRDDPSVVASLEQGGAAVPAKTETAVRQSAAPTQPAASTQQQTAAVAPDAGSAGETQSAPEPAQSATETETGTAATSPTFDIVRIERDGSAVMAGRAVPGSTVTALLDGKEIGNAETNERGEWVIVPGSTIAPGDHSITLSQTLADGAQSASDQSVALTVPDTADGQPLIVLSEASKPSRVLQKPQAPAKADEAEKVAAVEQQPASEPEPSTASGQAQQPQQAAPQQSASAEQPEQTGEPAGATSAVKQEQPATPAVTAGTAEPAETAKPAETARQPADAQRQLTVDVVDYDDTGRTTFSGMAQPGSRVRVYVSGRFTGEAQADDAGRWSLTPGRDIAAGTHALRADQVGGDGKVAQRIELPFLREQPERIAALQQQRKQDEAAASAATEPQSQPQGTQAGASAATTEPPTASETAAKETAAQEQVAAVAETEPAAAEPAAETPGKGRVVIQPGNNLWQISRVIYGKGVQYTVIYEANKDQIRNPDLIYPGQIFETPGSQAPESIDPDCRKPLAECEPQNQEAAQ